MLLPNGKESLVTVSSLRGKVASGGGGGRGSAKSSSLAMDAQGNALSVGDVVRLLTGAGATGEDVAQGTVKHIYKQFLYLYDFKRQQSAGIFVAKARLTVLATTRNATGGELAGGGGSAGGGGRSGAGRRGGNETAIGCCVIINKGRWKGRLGTIRGTSDTLYTVELAQGNQKHVPLPISDATIVSDKSGRSLNTKTTDATRGGGVKPHPLLALLSWKVVKHLFILVWGVPHLHTQPTILQTWAERWVPCSYALCARARARGPPSFATASFLLFPRGFLTPPLSREGEGGMARTSGFTPLALRAQYLMLTL